MIEPVSVISEAPARAMPKSVTLAWPRSSTITLCGLKSRWITPWRCAKPAASQDLHAEVDHALLRQRRLARDDLLERAAR